MGLPTTIRTSTTGVGVGGTAVSVIVGDAGAVVWVSVGPDVAVPVSAGEGLGALVLADSVLGCVGVAVGTKVAVAVLVGVAGGVFVGVNVRVAVGVAVGGVGVADGGTRVAVGGTLVRVGIGVGSVPATADTGPNN